MKNYFKQQLEFYTMMTVAQKKEKKQGVDMGMNEDIAQWYRQKYSEEEGMHR